MLSKGRQEQVTKSVRTLWVLGMVLFALLSVETAACGALWLLLEARGVRVVHGGSTRAFLLPAPLLAGAATFAWWSSWALQRGWRSGWAGACLWSTATLGVFAAALWELGSAQPWVSLGYLLVLGIPGIISLRCLFARGTLRFCRIRM